MVDRNLGRDFDKDPSELPCACDGNLDSDLPLWRQGVEQIWGQGHRRHSLHLLRFLNQIILRKRNKMFGLRKLSSDP